MDAEEQGLIEKNEHLLEWLEQKFDHELSYKKLTNDVLFTMPCKFTSNWQSLVTALQRTIKDTLHAYQGVPLVEL